VSALGGKQTSAYNVGMAGKRTPVSCTLRALAAKMNFLELK
jgi:hypothetical protein